MKWTRKPPRKEGWWWRRDSHHGASIVKVIVDGVGKFIWAYPYGTGITWYEVELAAEWSGPLLPPKAK